MNDRVLKLQLLNKREMINPNKTPFFSAKSNEQFGGKIIDVIFPKNAKYLRIKDKNIKLRPEWFLIVPKREWFNSDFKIKKLPQKIKIWNNFIKIKKINNPKFDLDFLNTNFSKILDRNYEAKDKLDKIFKSKQNILRSEINTEKRIIEQQTIFEKEKIIKIFLSSLDRKKRNKFLKYLKHNSNMELITDYYTSLITKKKCIPYDVRYLKKSVYNKTRKPYQPVKDIIYNYGELFDKRITPEGKIPIGKAIGIEIEFIFPSDNYDYLKKRLAYSGLTKYVNLGGDGSIDDFDCDEENCAEIRFIDNIDNFKITNKVCKVLSEIEARVNQSCGLHIHFDQRNIKFCESNFDLIYNKALNIFKQREFLYSMLPHSRRHNNFCQEQISADSFNSFSENSDRYSMVNIDSWEKHQTIEIRVHSGTINFEKIKQWAIICHTLMESEKRYGGDSFHEFIQFYFSDKPDTMNYMIQRNLKFTNKNNSTDNHEESEHVA